METSISTARAFRRVAASAEALVEALAAVLIGCVADAARSAASVQGLTMLRCCVFALAVAMPSLVSAQPVDWKAVDSEALKTLQGYVRINTSNPPGDVTKA